MKRICVLFSALLFFGIFTLSAQVSPDCGNAIPICNDTPVNGGTNGFGVDDFNGAAKSGCLEETITNAIESNSAWYRFRTGATGQLGFNIGIDTSEDWDFALYKAGDCSTLGEPIRCNFFDNQDQDSFLGIGEDPTGNASNIQYEDWIEVAPGEDYYLLINNFSNSNSGFSIQFSGNIFVTNPFDALDCSIVSNLLGPPISACEGTNVTLNATTSDAVTYNWFTDIGAGFEPIVGENSSVLVVSSSATYRVEVVRPAGNNIISDVHVGYSTMPNAFPLTDEAACSEDTTFDLSVKDIAALGSQSSDDFVVSYHNTLADANSGTNVIPKLFTIPSATKTIYVRVTSVQNPDCYDASQQFQLIRLETPVLDFPSEVFLCDGASSVTIGSSVTRPFHSYSWDSGELSSSIDVAQAGIYEITVTNTQNGVSCSNSKEVTVIVSNPPVISDIEIEDLEEENTVTVFTEEEGDWEYQMDNGSFQSSPIFNDVLAGTHTLTVNDIRGCGSVTEQIVVVGFPKFFTPNGDSMHDYWQIAGVGNLENPLVSIYDRYGKLLAQLTGNSQGWDGTFAGKPLPSSDYWFKLTYKDTNGQITEAKYINNHFSLKR
ncbi:T9SS type B sorting domain-containing protein [Maribacter algarum]|uniref:T9SS type B sorting domain-containing protein n=1 Tax=Maribacter algarum (ex Zhang et al. 2020) TaxID=2578118 RepID=A0A5S3PSI6_9FLAO|nr:T9SS type B sorting domain-containing protein [Maribacter algarum]TMM57949.1 T9SS type B sorting domain-containing protein [Maribacter algarum]